MKVLIPDYDDMGTLEVELQRPRVIDFIKNDRLPNHLLGVAIKQQNGVKLGTETIEDLKESILLTELYLRVCMVDPTYEEVKDKLTDYQQVFIHTWAVNPQIELEPFRTIGKDHSSDTDGKKVSTKTK